ncbi:hypothetical protein NIES4101_60190 [Calothrix sp. NIES-4101]|nr:hypothetical protein NIES4101_60190 [Calothrix sp. NIES-4101]
MRLFLSWLTSFLGFIPLGLRLRSVASERTKGSIKRLSKLNAMSMNELRIPPILPKWHFLTFLFGYNPKFP